MKLAIFALVVFVLGVAPGLQRYAGPPPDTGSPKRLVQQAEFEAQHPVLTRLAETLKLRL